MSDLRILHPQRISHNGKSGFILKGLVAWLYWEKCHQCSIFAVKKVSGRKKKPLYEAIIISDIGAEGKSLARVNDKVIFTTGAVPGDVVDLQVTRKRERYEEARVIRFHRYSDIRTDPFCRHFGLCGGCKWQNLPYTVQIKYKQKQVEEQLQRIGRLDLPPVYPILGSEQTIFYRNKLEFTFSNNRWISQDELEGLIPVTQRNVLGFHVPGMFDKVFAVENCWLQQEPSNKIRNFLYDYAISNRLTFFDLKQQTGFLRTLIIRTTTTGETMVIVTFFYSDEDSAKKLLAAISRQFPEITSLMWVVNSKGNDTITDQEVMLFKGREYITEEMEGLKFRIGPKSFFQTNPEQALRLYRKVRELAGLTGEETVYDLYCGTGTIACFVARFCRKVVGLEYVPEAVEDAGVNTGINGIENAEFIAGDIRELLKPGFLEIHGHPDVMITDPPRSGMHPDVANAIIEASPAKIVYVSCNPATQARDLALMSTSYTIRAVQPVDMFPHTHHVENIVLLVKKG